MTFKEKVLEACFGLLANNISALKNMMSELREGAQNDTKSSAGDKHETARAMMQLEQEKIAKQLGDSLALESLLEKIQTVLIKTDKGFLLIGVPLGKIMVDGIAVMTISPSSPLGTKLLGKKSGESVEINGITYLIESAE